jgi:hypothetical protein
LGRLFDDAVISCDLRDDISGADYRVCWKGHFDRPICQLQADKLIAVSENVPLSAPVESSAVHR